VISPAGLSTVRCLEMAGRVRGKWFGDVACGQFLAPDQSQNPASGGLDQHFESSAPDAASVSE
jgi:hypothetical protein